MDSRELYSQLTPWHTLQIARHQDRPHAGDYISRICDTFLELHGDRTCKDDRAILAGPAHFMGMTVMFICHQKGRGSKGRQEHNFGMPHPEGYRKALRLMKQAERFGFPLICLIDTPGAFPGLEDEERGQAEAIAANLSVMSRLRVPIVAVVIGEGSSGGALALGVADRLLMLEHSVYTVAALKLLPLFSGVILHSRRKQPKPCALVRVNLSIPRSLMRSSQSRQRALIVTMQFQPATSRMRSIDTSPISSSSLLKISWRNAIRNFELLGHLPASHFQQPFNLHWSLTRHGTHYFNRNATGRITIGIADHL